MLRLPTPQCAPNFAFLMAADARNAVRRLPEVGRVTITLEDHYTGDEINDAIGRGDGFTGAFPGETADDELAALRELFQRKALIARQAAVCEALLAAGAAAGRLRLPWSPTCPTTRRARRLPRVARRSSASPRSGRARVRAAQRQTARGRPARRAGCGWRGSCARASRPMAASAARYCKFATAWRPRILRRFSDEGRAAARVPRPARSSSSIDEPKIVGPLDVIVQDRRSRACAGPICTSRRASGPRSLRSCCPTRPVMRTPAGCTRSARASPTSRWATR